MDNINSLLKERARELRKSQTESEQKLWQALRKRQILNAKFRRQFCIGYYIVDFICLPHKLIIEVDGAQHLEQFEYDQIRTAFLNAAGYEVIRFWNDEVQDLDYVLEAIHNRIITLANS